jgi:murein L,D-transpeptidase YcbB/YkuD
MSGMLVKGSTGPAVKELQRRLNLCLSRPPLLVEDGIFGPRTLAKVIEFQSTNGLRPDGIVGKNTEALLVILTPCLSRELVEMDYGEWCTRRELDISRREKYSFEE